MYYYSTPVKKEKAESDKMSSDSSDRRLAKPPHMGAPPPEQEHLPCPRCESTNTKFCYYNNYNLSQPRHFCKSCRRYWTQGGTLRNIPVGGGSRKNTKRSRSSSTTSSTQDPLSATPISMLPVSAEPDFSIPNLNVSGSFTSLLNTQASGFLALGGFGLGLGSGFEDVSFGLGNKVSWPFAEIGESGGGCGGVGNITAAGTTVGNSWQLGNGESALVDGECFAWPDLAISTPGKSLK